MHYTIPTSSALRDHRGNACTVHHIIDPVPTYMTSNNSLHHYLIGAQATAE